MAGGEAQAGKWAEMSFQKDSATRPHRIRLDGVTGFFRQGLELLCVFAASTLDGERIGIGAKGVVKHAGHQAHDADEVLAGGGLRQGCRCGSRYLLDETLFSQSLRCW